MTQTPRGLRRHVAIFGHVNAGKSTLFNQLTGTQMAIVSEHQGTTTDPVSKSMELNPFGPIVLIDTAGIGDPTPLGKQRLAKTTGVSTRTDLSLLVIDGSEHQPDQDYQTLTALAASAHLYVISKADLTSDTARKDLQAKYPTAIWLSNQDPAGISALKSGMIQHLTALEDEAEDLSIGRLLPYGSTVLMVIPIDSAAPKGRLILPQVQLLRECLDHGIKTYVVRDKELTEALTDLKQIDLVVCDSQVFGAVNAIIPKELPLISFSMFLAYQKGNLAAQIEATQHIAQLTDGAQILMLEACSHSTTHEDIGTVKIPGLLRKKTGKTLHFHHFRVHDIPEDLSLYDFVIMCGSCMINRKEVTNRLELMAKAGVPATNYGVVLAYLTDILERCQSVFLEVNP